MSQCAGANYSLPLARLRSWIRSVMSFGLTILILSICFGLVTGIFAALLHHKKAVTGDLELVGSTAVVTGTLRPEGTVLVCGELWRARSRDGIPITANSKVHVIGAQDHLLVVERDELFLTL